MSYKNTNKHTMKDKSTGAIKVTDIMTCGGYRLISCHGLDYRLIHTIFCIGLEGFRIVFSH